MPWLEADIAVIKGNVIENFSMRFSRDVYFKTVFIPGFSDSHAHPQVIDGGLDSGGLWSNSYEWLTARNLHVDEAMVRNDIGLSSELASLAMRRALLEGTTLIAFTGKFEANLKAKVGARVSPRLVVLPTVMRRRGWSTPLDLESVFKKYKRFINDNLLKIGVFVHSVAYSAPKMLEEAFDLARKNRLPLGIHLSEGINEREEFLKLTGNKILNTKIVAVHCINEDYLDLGIKCAGCPPSNLILYGKTRTSLNGVTSFGSDWPHLLGTIGSNIPLLYRLYKPDVQGLLYRATVGGYRDYGIETKGDLTAFDEPLEKILRDGALPKMVSVAGEITVWEGRLIDTGESYIDILRATRDVIQYAVSLYGDGIFPKIPEREELIKRAEEFIKSENMRSRPIVVV